MFEPGRAIRVREDGADVPWARIGLPQTAPRRRWKELGEPVLKVLVDDIEDLPDVAEAYGLTLEELAGYQFLGQLPDPDRPFFGWLWIVPRSEYIAHG